jgi:hypothetical protein
MTKINQPLAIIWIAMTSAANDTTGLHFSPPVVSKDASPKASTTTDLIFSPPVVSKDASHRASATADPFTPVNTNRKCGLSSDKRSSCHANEFCYDSDGSDFFCVGAVEDGHSCATRDGAYRLYPDENPCMDHAECNKETYVCVKVGKRPLGGSCWKHTDCKDSLFCTGGGQKQGTCQNKLKDGEVCFFNADGEALTSGTKKPAEASADRRMCESDCCYPAYNQYECYAPLGTEDKYAKYCNLPEKTVGSWFD